MDTIDVKNLSIGYSGRKKSISDCSFSVRDGEIFGLLGSNGAGKSTIMKTLAGMIKGFKGEIRILEKDYRAYLSFQPHIAYVPQHPCMFEDFTVKENIKFFCHMDGLGENAVSRTEELLNMFSLKPFENIPAGRLSGGFKQLLNIALSMIIEKKIVMFDEPTAGLDLWTKKLVSSYIKKLKDEGRTIILTTHDLKDAEELCDRMLIISDGAVLAYGETKDLLRNLGGGYTIKALLRKPLAEKTLKLRFSNTHDISDTAVVVDVSPDNIAKAITELVAVIEKSGVGVADIYVKEPSLTEVFFNIMKKKEQGQL